MDDMTLKDRNVFVFADEQESRGTRQPKDFHCCPSGIEFCVEDPIDTFRVLDLKFKVPENLEHLTIKMPL